MGRGVSDHVGLLISDLCLAPPCVHLECGIGLLFETFPSGCMLEAGKEVVFNPEEDEFEHQLDLRMVSSLRSRSRVHLYPAEALFCSNFFSSPGLC